MSDSLTVYQRTKPARAPKSGLLCADKSQKKKTFNIMTANMKLTFKTLKEKNKRNDL